MIRGSFVFDPVRKRYVTSESIERRRKNFWHRFKCFMNMDDGFICGMIVSAVIGIIMATFFAMSGRQKQLNNEKQEATSVQEGIEYIKY